MRKYLCLIYLLLNLLLPGRFHAAETSSYELQKQRTKELYAHERFTNLRDNGTYTCDELIRWLGTEKHYSNDKKEIILGMLNEESCKKNSFGLVNQLTYGWTATGAGKRSFFQDEGKNNKCVHNDKIAVVYLSNFSINNNFSHFLHSLLRLFCALVDAQLLQWAPGDMTFHKVGNYTIWLDEYYKLTDAKKVWLSALTNNNAVRHLNTIERGTCVKASKAVYGSGCVKLLPPEKWFGYPGCRAKEMLPAFGYFMRQHFMASNEKDLLLLDDSNRDRTDPGLRLAFAVRDVGDLTGRRTISNLGDIQALLKKTQHVRSSTENITFEHLDVPSTIRYMAGVHVFVSVHGAGMTNMFFMNPGSAVLEIIPYPLCNCRSPDYFYGTGGYYHGSAIAQGIKHYHYCVPAQDITWHEKPDFQSNGGKCSWRALHAVESLTLDPTRFVSLMRNIERDLVAIGTIELTAPIINMSPHANG